MQLLRHILLVLVFSTSLLYARPDFRSGYIIDALGDTIVGKIDYQGDLLMGSVCIFEKVDSVIKEYSPNDILAYRFTDGKYYVSREIESKKVFLEYLIKGKVNIYYLRDNAGDHYFLDKEGLDLTEIPYESGTKYVNNREVYYETKTHLGILHYYMQDAPEFESKIQYIKEPNHQNLVDLAEEYHKVVCDGEKCIIYEKKQPFIKVNIEVVSGILKFTNSNNISNKVYFQNGVLAHFWMPRTNEKVYFKTGFLYSNIQYTTDPGDSYTKVPLHIGYMAPNTYRVRPSFSISLFSPSFCGGIAVKLNKRVNLGIQSWANFTFDKLTFIPRDLLNYSLLGSLYIEL